MRNEKAYHEKKFLHAKMILCVTETKIIVVTCFNTHFSKTTAHRQVILEEKHFIIIIFKLCESNVNL